MERDYEGNELDMYYFFCAGTFENDYATYVVDGGLPDFNGEISLRDIN
jgi:hypothetical protein